MKRDGGRSFLHRQDLDGSPRAGGTEESTIRNAKGMELSEDCRVEEGTSIAGFRTVLRQGMIEEAWDPENRRL